MYLLPDGPAAQQPYALLVEALRDCRKWGLARVVLSGRRYLTLIRPSGRVLAVHVLHYPEQLRPSATLEPELRQVSANDAERQLATQLIDAGTRPVIWPEYRDDNAEQLRTLIEAKLRGCTPQAPAPEETPVLKLLDALKESVAQAVKQRQVPEATVPSAERKGRKRASRRSA